MILDIIIPINFNTKTFYAFSLRFTSFIFYDVNTVNPIFLFDNNAEN